MPRSLKIGIVLSFFIVTIAHGQDRFLLQTTIENNINFFIRDSLIGAAGIPQYENNDIGGEIWVDFVGRYKGFEAGLRLDAFRNSNLLNPTDAYSAEGLGRFYLKKSVGKFDFHLGYLYDQIGSGIIFRSYEIRPQLIDNAFIGGKATYWLNDDIFISGYYGRQKRQFDIYGSDIRGVSAEGYFSFDEEGQTSISPGIGYINRRLSQDDIDGIVDVIRTYVDEDRVIPRYNTYSFTLYNTLSHKKLQWYTEWALKTPELFFDPNATRTEISGRTAFGKYVKRTGSVFYSSLSLALDNLGITLEGKRTSNFDFRANPLLRQNDGFISFIPPMNRQSTYRLLTRYNPATQVLSEMAWQVDINHKISKSWSWNVNVSDVYTLSSTQLFKELYFAAEYKNGRKSKLTGGAQFIAYNQRIYEVKPNVGMLRANTFFTDFLYKLGRRTSLRTEVQYMSTEQDYGSWLFGLVEVGFKKYWTVELSGMYNSSPGPASPEDNNGIKQKILYPSLGLTFNTGSKRISARYVKQVEGVICTGGICRLEPAFSGFRIQSYVQL